MSSKPINLAKIKRIEHIVFNLLLAFALIGLTLFVIGV